MNANSSPTTHNWLQGAVKELQSAGIPTAELDALVLLEDCLEISRANILAHPESKLMASQITKLNKQIERRKTHEPLAYIRGKTEFYGREFIVNRYTLEPRPETETMIELLIKQKISGGVVIADIGTGSGAIAVTVQLEFPKAKLVATDLSPHCLKTAEQNIKNHGVDTPCFKGDLLKPLKDQKIDILLCNLPYVPDNFGINKAALHEPKMAIFGGDDGLNLYRKLFKQINERKQKPSLVFTESLPFQHEKLTEIATTYGYKHVESEDFIQVFKT